MIQACICLSEGTSNKKVSRVASREESLQSLGRVRLYIVLGDVQYFDSPLKALLMNIAHKTTAELKEALKASFLKGPKDNDRNCSILTIYHKSRGEVTQQKTACGHCLLTKNIKININYSWIRRHGTCLKEGFNIYPFELHCRLVVIDRKIASEIHECFLKYLRKGGTCEL